MVQKLNDVHPEPTQKYVEIKSAELFLHGNGKFTDSNLFEVVATYIAKSKRFVQVLHCVF